MVIDDQLSLIQKTIPYESDKLSDYFFFANYTKKNEIGCPE